jgi:O-antigen/teichoic acid export membrane protein
MLNKLKYFVKQSAIYGIGNLSAKASGIILLPLYTTFLSLGEFGVLGIIDVTILILVEFINLGQGQALVMLNNSDEYTREDKSVFFTILTSSTLICIIFIIIGEIFLPYISNIFSDPTKYYVYLRLSIYIIAARVINNIFLNKLRADEKSSAYTFFSILKLALTLLLTIYFVAYVKLKITGILYSYLISEVTVDIILLIILLKKLVPKFEKKIMYASITFGIPLIFGSLAMMLLNVSDRYIIKYFTYNEMVGLYDLGYRFAGILNNFFIMPFTLTLMPQAYKIYKKEGDKRYYSKLMTYLTFGLVWLGLGLSMFSKEIIKIFALNPSFWSAYKIVPIVTAAYIFFGMRIVASLGMFLTKKTKYVAITTIFAAAINISLNILLIPKFGMITAAYTTLIAFFILYISSYYYSNKCYKIPFENSKIFKVFLLGVIFYFISSFVNEGILAIRLSVKLFLLIIFPMSLLLVKFYEPVELEKIRGFYRKWKSPGRWKENSK